MSTGPGHGPEPAHPLSTLAVVFGGVGVLATALLTYVLFGRAVAREADTVVLAAGAVAGTVDRELDRRSFVVRALAATAEEVLEARSATVAGVVAHLRPRPEGGFTLAVPPGFEPRELGNITGGGEIPEEGSPRARELAMAFALTPAFRAAARHDPDLPWAYYLSRDRFLYIFPRVPPEKVAWTEALGTAHFSYRGQPPEALERRIYWSEIYDDFGGKGLLATASHPVFEGDRLIGSVSVDVAMASLVGLLERSPVPHSSLHLLTHEGKHMAGTGAGPLTVDVGALPASGQVSVGGDDITVLPLRTADWILAVRTPRQAKWAAAASASVAYGGFVLLVLAGVLLALALRRTLRELRALSVRDGLTGLFNRRHFDEVARLEVEQCRRAGPMVGLALVDVDHFKDFNDHHGHQSGDRTLRAVATVLQRTLRRAGDQVFRVGGEEFAVLARIERPDQLQALAERIREAIRDAALPHDASPHRRVTVSIGAVVVGASAWVDLDTAYQRADLALYRAKQAGRDRVELG